MCRLKGCENWATTSDNTESSDEEVVDDADDYYD